MPRQPSDTYVPTIADLTEHGYAACLDALRTEYREAHSRYPQYRGRETTAVLGVVRRRLDKDGTSFVRADTWDLVLVWKSPTSWLSDFRDHDRIYAPRVGWDLTVFAAHKPSVGDVFILPAAIGVAA